MSLKDRVARYKKKMWDFWRANGNCGRCGKPAGIHRTGPKKGQSYAECFKHRRKTAARAKGYLRVKRGYPRPRTVFGPRDSIGRFICVSSSRSEKVSM